MHPRWTRRTLCTTATATLFAASLGPAATALAQPAAATPAHRWTEAPTFDEQARDAAAFQEADTALARQFTDVESAVVVLRGRVVHTFYRDADASKLRDTQSVAKSALAILVGTALAQGHLTSLDQKFVDIIPSWASANSDPRAANITLCHLLTLTAGFAVNDASGTAAPLSPRDAFARPLASDPGTRFAYDNSVVPMLMAVLETATRMPLADYARQQLGTPLGFAEPPYQRGLHLRTLDMAKLGHLMLQRGQWEGRALLPEAFADAAVQAQNAGGPPAGLPYGYLWWVVPSTAARPTFFASGYSGQYIWVNPAADLVVATTSTVSRESQRRGQALQWIRNHAYAAALKRAQAEAR